MSMMLDPYRFGQAGGDAGAEVMRMASFAMRTTAGTQNLTIPNFNAELGPPKFARVFCSRVTSLDSIGGNPATSIGCYDGTTQFVCGIQDAEGATANSRTIWESGSIIALGIFNSSTTFDCEAVVTGWITDGLQINVTNPPAAAYLIVLELYYHADWQFEINLTSVTGTQNITYSVPFSFDPEFVMAYCPLYPIDSNSLNYPKRISEYYGAASGGVGRISYMIHPSNVRDAQNRMSDQGLPFIDNRYLEIGLGTGELLVTPRNNSWPHSTAYIGINFGGSGEAWVGVANSPTGVGTFTLEGASPPTWVPSIALVLYGEIEALNLTYTDNRSANGWGIFNADDGFSIDHVAKDGGSFGYTSGFVTQGKLRSGYIPTATFDILRRGDLAGMDEGGPTFDIDTAANVKTYLYGLVLLRGT